MAQNHTLCSPDLFHSSEKAKFAGILSFTVKMNLPEILLLAIFLKIKGGMERLS